MKRNSIFVIVIILGALLVASMSQRLSNLALLTVTPAFAQTTGQVKGVLVYENTHKSAEGLLIALPRASIDNNELQALKFEGRYAKTDTFGTFHFVNIPPGKYVLFIQNSGEGGLANEKEEVICEVRAGEVTDFGKIRIEKPKVSFNGEIRKRGKFVFDIPIRLRNNKFLEAQ